MIRQCRFCGQQFNAKSDEVCHQTICISCKESVLNCLKEDKEFLNDVVNIINNDDEILKKIVKSMFNIPAQEIGLGGPGSLADFFR